MCDERCGWCIKHGGTWLRLNDMSLGSRMTHTTLVRFSTQGFLLFLILQRGVLLNQDIELVLSVVRMKSHFLKSSLMKTEKCPVF